MFRVLAKSGRLNRKPAEFCFTCPALATHEPKRRSRDRPIAAAARCAPRACGLRRAGSAAPQGFTRARRAHDELRWTGPVVSPLHPRWTGASPAPLVVMMHGGFGSAEQAERAYGWDELADSAKFVVAYPDGVGRAWNVNGGCCGRAGPGEHRRRRLHQRGRRRRRQQRRRTVRRLTARHHRRRITTSTAGCPDDTQRRRWSPWTAGTRVALVRRSETVGLLRRSPRLKCRSITAIVRLSGKCNSEACQTRMSSPTRSRRWRTTTPPPRRC